MPKSSKAKVELAKKLLDAGVSYRKIQDILHETFGSGMSNTTLQKLSEEQDEIKDLKQKIERLEFELEKARHDAALYKHLYNDLLQTLKEKD
jgi:DNA-binding transcriptional MerR regulator